MPETWKSLYRQLDRAALPHTLAGIAALRHCTEAEALDWMRTEPELEPTAEVLSDPEAMADLAGA